MSSSWNETKIRFRVEYDHWVVDKRNMNDLSIQLISFYEDDVLLAL
jgi:hypothetical protein